LIEDNVRKKGRERERENAKEGERGRKKENVHS
jgi:hypothetical protein